MERRNMKKMRIQIPREIMVRNSGKAFLIHMINIRKAEGDSPYSYD